MGHVHNIYDTGPQLRTPPTVPSSVTHVGTACTCIGKPRVKLVEIAPGKYVISNIYKAMKVHLERKECFHRILVSENLQHGVFAQWFRC